LVYARFALIGLVRSTVRPDWSTRSGWSI